MTDALQPLLGEAARRLRAARGASALLVQLNDADGLMSAALLTLALEALGFAVERLAVEKIFPELVGLSGDLDSSASALAYLVLRQLVPAGELYADLGVIGAAFAPMGVKSVGTFCERIAGAEWADPGSYVAGMQPFPGEIPGLGHFAWDLRKVSVRVPKHLAEEVLNGRSPDLMQLVPAACKAADGFADGCHRLAAAATIPGDAAGRFIQALARVADAG